MSNSVSVWVFHGDDAQFAGGVFRSKDAAVAWIRKHGLSGLLTAYPLDRGVYDWALDEGVFQPKRPEQSSCAFIQRFSSAAQEHYRFDEGAEC